MDLCLLSNDQNNWERWILALSFVELHWKGLWECRTTTAPNWEGFLRERLEAAAALIFLQVYFQWCWAILPFRVVCGFISPNWGILSLTSSTSTGSAVFRVPWRGFWMLQAFGWIFFFSSKMLLVSHRSRAAELWMQSRIRGSANCYKHWSGLCRDLPLDRSLLNCCSNSPPCTRYWWPRIYF